MNFNFVASNQFDLSFLKDIENFVDHFPDFQTVWLTDENELELLLALMEIHEHVEHAVQNDQFSKYWDISNFKLPELDDQQFEKFYQHWLEKSKRNNNMDEYGNLIFLQGLSSKWNRLKYRLIIKEAI